VIPAAAVLVAVELAVGLGFLAAQATTVRPPAPRASQQAAPYAEVQALLTARGIALARHDKTAFLAGVDQPFVAAQSRLFDNLRKLPLQVATYALDARVRLDAPARYGVPAYLASVVFTVQLAGFDQIPSAQTQYLTFVQRGGRWLLASDRDLAGGTRGLWDLTAIDTLTSASVLVVYDPAERSLAASCLAAAQRGVRRVAAVWPSGWARRVVIVVPSAAAVPELTQSSADLTHIAAVTTADFSASGVPTGSRVVVNTPTFRTLSRPEVLLTHEITHVATRGVTTASTPLWLAEGFADYVAYRDAGLPVRTVARELAASSLSLDALPVQSDFAGPGLALAYQESWLACRLIASRVGEAGVVRFYAAVGGAGGDVDSAVARGLREVLGMTPEQFVAAWRAYVTSQVG
jgi:Zn-dependent protease with chaperone function